MTDKVLVDQKTAEPTRKMWAVLIAAMIAGALNGALQFFFPYADFTNVIEPLSPYIMAAIMGFAGYMTRERHD